MRSTVLLFALILTHYSDVAGQLPAWVRPGARLRLTTAAAPEPLVGTLISFDGDSVRVRADADGDAVSLPVAGVTGVDVSRERGTRAGVGARTGFVAGAAFGAIAILSNSDVGNKGLGALAFGGVFGLLGAGVGGLIGASMSTDAWEPITLRGAGVRVVPATGGIAVALAIHL